MLSELFLRLSRSNPQRDVARWKWKRLQPEELKIMLFSESKNTDFGFEIKRLYPEVSINLPTERRKETTVHRRIRIQGAKYWFASLEHEVSILPVDAWIGDEAVMDDPGGGNVRFRFQQSKWGPGIVASCRIAGSFPGACDQLSPLFWMFDFVKTFSPQANERIKKELWCTISFSGKIDQIVFDQIDAGESETSEFKSEIRDIRFKIIDDDPSIAARSGYAFVAKNDYGLVEDVSFLDKLFRFNPKGDC